MSELKTSGKSNSFTGYKNADAMAFGLYLQPKIMNNLTTTIGAAGSVIDGDFTDWSADLRLYYKAGALSFTSFHSYSAIVDAEENAAKLNGKGNAATKGIATSKALGDSMQHKGTAPSRDAPYKQPDGTLQGKQELCSIRCSCRHDWSGRKLWGKT